MEAACKMSLRTKRKSSLRHQKLDTFFRKNPAAAVQTREVDELDEQARSCTLCILSSLRTNAVPGEGKIDSPQLMIIGEAPGRNEDDTGRPFVGSGGKLLDNLLEKAGLSRNDVYITNIVKCRPPKNRKPKRDEIEICTSAYLERQIQLIRPKLICTLGLTAIQYFTRQKTMAAIHGKLTKSKNGRQIYPTYHPAAVFRNRPLKDVLDEDLRRIPAVLKEIERQGKN